MPTIQFEYQGDLHCKASHVPSGAELTTDAPKDSHGRAIRAEARAFSPLSSS